MSNRLFKDYTEAEKYTQTLNNKISCRAATTNGSNITLSETQTIDGVSLKLGDRVLVKNQSEASENGIYTCFSGGWHRSPDMDTTTKCRASSYIFIEEGSSIENVHKLFQLTLPDNASLVLGNSSLTFSEYGISGININGGSGSGINVIDDGNGDITISVNVDDTTIKINESNQVSAITASITEGATTLANGSQIYDFVYDNAVLLTTDQTIEGHKTFNGSMTINGNVSGNVTGDVTGNLNGNASTATIATNAIDISGITRSENSNTVLYINESNNYATASMTSFARTLLDDNSSSEARTTLGVDTAGTDNSTDVTLTSVASNYLTLTGQEITASIVPLSLGGTGATTDSAARTALGVDPAGTDNSTDVTLTSVASNYLTLTGQEITASIVPLSLGGTGATTDSAARTVLGIEIGTHVQAHDDGLSSIAGLTTTADNIIYTTGLDNYVTASLTSFARTLLDDNSSSEARNTLGVDLAGTDNSTEVTLSNTNYLSISGQVLTGKTVPVGSGGTGSTNLTKHGILTGNGASAVNSSSNLTFDGSDLILTGDTTLNGSMTLNGSLNLGGNIIPKADITYDLGSASNRFNDLYLSGKTLHLGDTNISTNASGDIEFMAKNNIDRRKLMVNEIILGNSVNRVSLKSEDDKLKIRMRDSDGTGNPTPMALDVDDGGTGQSTFENGQLLIGNSSGNTLTKSSLTEGNNITITNSSGSITISSTDTNTTYSGGNGINLSGTEFTVAGGDGLTHEASGLKINSSQTTVTSILNTDLVVGRDSDNQIKFSTDDTIIFRTKASDGVKFLPNGEIEASSLDISGNASIDGTLEADAITIDGVTLSTYISNESSSNGKIESISHLNLLSQTYQFLYGHRYYYIFAGLGLGGAQYGSGTERLEVDFTATSTHGYLEYGFLLNSNTAGEVVMIGVSVGTGGTSFDDVSLGTSVTNKHSRDAGKLGLLSSSHNRFSLYELCDLDNHENFITTGKFVFENLTVGTRYKMGLYGKVYTSSTSGSSGDRILIMGGGLSSGNPTRNNHMPAHLKFVAYDSSIVV